MVRKRPFIADRHVRAFDAAIDPETRLVLAEAGQQLLADADVITIPTTHRTPRPAEPDLGHHPPRGRGGRVHDRHLRCPDRWDT